MVGLDAEELDRSFAVLALSFGAKPKPSGDGRGVVDRLFKAPKWPADLEDSCRDDGESAPPGEEFEVLGCSTLTFSYRPYELAPVLGDVVLLARGDWRPAAGFGPLPWPIPSGCDWPMPNGHHR